MNKLTTVNQIIDHIINSFDKYNFADIKNARQNNINIGCFILCGCFIDQLAHFRYFKKVKGEGDKFAKFVTEYLPNDYNGSNLYQSFRSTLVHNYSLGKKFNLAWGDRSIHLKQHLQTMCLDLDQFIDDVETAYSKYKNELRTFDEIKEIALKHHAKYPTLTQLM